MPKLAMPSFDAHKDEALLIGRMLVGYGELEYELCQCVAVVHNLDLAVKAMFRPRGESQRIQIADALVRPAYDAMNLGQGFAEAVGDLSFCLSVRNQYAHCNWYNLTGQPLGFVNLEDSAKSNASLSASQLNVYWLDKTLLTEQEAFFGYTQECLWHLQYEYRLRTGKIANHAFPMPKKAQRPPKHK
jgi:hypothetical protein